MANPRLISLHPKLAAVLDGLFSLFLLWWAGRLQTPSALALWFGIRLIWWIVLSQIVYYPPYLNRVRHLVSLFIFTIGITPFIIFGDPSTALLTNVFMVGMPLISFWLIPAASDSLSVMVKPHRRWKLIMSLFGVAGLWLCLEASTAFQIISGWHVFCGIAVAALLTAGISAWEWNEYGLRFSTPFFQIAATLFILFVEIGFIVFLWPVGYLITSLFIAWLWYVLWLMFRFNLSEDGIRWEQQRFFLITNLVLMVLFLAFVVRWK